MRVQLDTPNPAIEQAELDKIDTNNTLKLQQTINKTGVNSGLLKQVTTQTSITNTTAATIQSMQGVITSSGGFFNIDFKSSVQAPAAIDVYFSLLIDGVIKDTALVSNDVVAVVKLEFRGSLGAGRHNIAVQTYLSSAGTGIYSYAGTYTTLQAVETVL